MDNPIQISQLEAGPETDLIVATLMPIPGVELVPNGFGEASKPNPKRIARWKYSYDDGEGTPYFSPSVKVVDAMIMLQTHFKCFSLETFHGRHQVTIGTGPGGSFATSHMEEASSLELAACMAALYVWRDQHPDTATVLGRPLI